MGSGNGGTLIEGGFPSLEERAAQLAESHDREKRRWLNWPELAQGDAPEYEWLIPHWLGWHPTLLSGRGSIGKSLLAQQIGTALSLGAEFLGEARPPLKVLMWMCEDDHDELWRRQEHICKAFGVMGVGNLPNLTIDARLGLNNVLYGLDHGQGGWAMAYGELKEQIEETQADVLVLDNVGHCYGASENSRHDVTTFCAGIAGLCPDRKFSSVLIGHLAKAQGSEYAGSTAWENAVRMRWYMGDKLPDQQSDEDGEPDSTVRYLCKRKANYTALDYVQLNYAEGVFALAKATDYTLTGSMRSLQAKRIVLDGLIKLTAMGMSAGSTKGANFLPSLLVEYRLNEDLSRFDLKTAMQALMVSGELVRGVVGKYPNRTPKYGLVRASSETAQS